MMTRRNGRHARPTIALATTLALTALPTLWGCQAPVTVEVQQSTGPDEASAPQSGASTPEVTSQDTAAPQDPVGDTDEATVTDGSSTRPIDPRTFAIGQVLSEDDVERAGGIDALFWAEPIPDDVFSRMEGKSFGPDCTLSRDDLCYLRMLHADAEGRTLVGELVVNASVGDEVASIFRQLYDARYPIKKMRLVDDYGADDFASCSDGNTSAFNYRNIAGSTQLSNHALGLAIDINTFENPYCIPSTGYIFPPEAERYADRSLYEPYMTHPGDICYELFISHGWSWGGDWSSPKDYQHFEKVL